MAVVGVSDGFFEVKNNGGFVFVEELTALGDVGDLGGTAGVLAVLGATKHAFHADPLADGDIGAFDPFEIGVAVFFEQCPEFIFIHNPIVALQLCIIIAAIFYISAPIMDYFSSRRLIIQEAKGGIFTSLKQVKPLKR